MQSTHITVHGVNGELLCRRRDHIQELDIRDGHITLLMAYPPFEPLTVEVDPAEEQRLRHLIDGHTGATAPAAAPPSDQALIEHLQQVTEGLAAVERRLAKAFGPSHLRSTP